VNVLDIDVCKVLNRLVGMSSLLGYPDVDRHVCKWNKPLTIDLETRVVRYRLVTESDRRLVLLHQHGEIAGKLITSFPADGEVSNFSPILVMAEAPVS